MIIFPAIDLIGGEVVRLKEGDFASKKSYSKNPEDVARTFLDAGLMHLHLVDLDAARRDGNNLLLLEKLSLLGLVIDYGGGIRGKEDAERAFSAGANKVNVGSLAVREQEKMLDLISCYPGKIILSADVKDELIRISGWEEKTDLEIIPFLSFYKENGITESTVTDIKCDGMLCGPSFELYSKIMNELTDLNLIASGGISGKEDLLRLSSMGLYGVIVGKAYYEGKISLAEMKEIECLQRG